MDTSRSSCLTPTMLRMFVNTHQMEQIDEAGAVKLIQVILHGAAALPQSACPTLFERKLCNSLSQQACICTTHEFENGWNVSTEVWCQSYPQNVKTRKETPVSSGLALILDMQNLPFFRAFVGHCGKEFWRHWTTQHGLEPPSFIASSIWCGISANDT